MNRRAELRLLVCNRETAEQVAFPEAHIMISISSPSDEAKLPLNMMRMGLLRLGFYDLSSPLENYQIFTEEMTVGVWDFVGRWLSAGDTGLLLVVHCDAGLSRSPAIAAAISKHYSGDDSYYFKRYLPNTLVHRIMMNVINRRRRHK